MFRTYDNMSSSPLSLPSTIAKPRPQSRTGSLAAPMPQQAIASFATAASLLELDKTGNTHPKTDVESGLPTQLSTAEAPSKPVKMKTAPKLRVKKIVPAKEDGENGVLVKDQGETAIERPARKSRAKKVTATSTDNSTPKETPARKPRAKPETGQAKIAKGKITKPSLKSTGEKASKKKTGVVSAHFPPTTSKAVDIYEIPSDEDIPMQEAVKRRTDWTPPRPIVQPSFETSVFDIAETGDPSVDIDRPITGEGQTGFADLFGSFGYSKSSDAITRAQDTIDMPPPRKRKLIELVKINNYTLSPLAQPKPKAAKKKPRTITGKATSAFLNEDEENMGPSPILQYFSVNNSESDNDEFNSTSGRANGPSRASRSTKITAPAPILLSPESALKRAKRQEFVFGTSSQLAREDSPTFLGELQQATHLLNQEIDDPFSEYQEPLDASSSNSGLDRGKGKMNLWEAASGADDTMDAVILDRGQHRYMILKETRPISRNAHEEPSLIEYLPTPEADGDWYCLDDDTLSLKISKLPPAISTIPSSSPAFEPVQKVVHRDTEEIVPTTVGIASPIKGKPTKVWGSRTLSGQMSIPQKPDFETFTTAQLSKQIASYHFKPVRSRKQMIALLERCWEGQHRVALGNLGTNKQLVTSHADALEVSKTMSPIAESPKRPRGRPKKNSQLLIPSQSTISELRSSQIKPMTKTFNSTTSLNLKPKIPSRTAIPTLPEEISDSDTPMTPSPPRRRRSLIGTPPAPLHLTIDSSTLDDLDNLDETTMLTPSSNHAHLFRLMTRAITSAPRTSNPQNPSWHEKILMYDPIILEDLTMWLNTGALEKVGYDQEVGAAEVKMWCLQRGVCCLSKLTTRNGTRVNW
jgi:hypothetical protein